MEQRHIAVRNLRFPLDSSLPRVWFAGSRVMSLFMDHLSIVFPPGERFFMQSVRAFEGRIEDPALKQAVRAFHAQEALHGREHASYNDLLRERGFPVDAIDRSARGILWLAEKLLPKSWQLAVTAALEHFTAMLAQFLLAHDSVLQGSPAAMSAMWRWHAAEENEHAAVAFDVYRAIGGSYFARVLVMAGTTLFFWLKMLEHQVRMMHADGCLFSLREWSYLLRFAFVAPGVFPLLWRTYCAYYRPSFHPHQVECSDLLAAWRKQYEDEPIYLESRYSPSTSRASAAQAASAG